uniref:Uncharacterized protein n=1 Tax=Romanomermis culicivorax TaxID=13658 RepID=A0A915HNM7_ROMCU
MPKITDIRYEFRDQTSPVYIYPPKISIVSDNCNITSRYEFDASHLFYVVENPSYQTPGQWQISMGQNVRYDAARPAKKREKLFQPARYA